MFLGRADNERGSGSVCPSDDNEVPEDKELQSGHEAWCQTTPNIATTMRMTLTMRTSSPHQLKLFVVQADLH